MCLLWLHLCVSEKYTAASQNQKNLGKFVAAKLHEVADRKALRSDLEDI